MHFKKIALTLTLIYKKSFIAFLTNSELLSDIVNKTRVNGKGCDEKIVKSLSTLFISLKKPTKINYLIFNTKKTF